MNRSNHSSRLAFSLLEMVIAMFIVSILMGLVILGTRSLLEDEQLRAASRKLVLMAKTARQYALLENRPYEIVMQADRWTLRPVRDESSGEEASAVSELGFQEDEVEPVEYVLPEKIKMKIRLWGSTDWEKPLELVWHFSAVGLCAPNSFRLEKEDSWMQVTFNPLTANAQEEEWYLP